MTTRRKPTPDPWDFETLMCIDKRIDTSEAEGIRDRWEFGQAMLAARGGKKRLPNGYLAQLVERTGKSQSELSYRLRFAEKYPTEVELSNALESYPSWHEIVESLYGKPELTREAAEALTAKAREIARRRYQELSDIFSEIVRRLEPGIGREAIEFGFWNRVRGEDVRSLVAAGMPEADIATLVGITGDEVREYIEHPYGVVEFVESLLSELCPDYGEQP